MNKLIELSKKTIDIINTHGQKYIVRDRKTNAINTFLFALLHTQKNISMNSVAANINAYNIQHTKNTSTISRQSFLSRYNSLPLDFFKSIYDDIGNQLDLIKINLMI
jgi:hypothetical protein